MSVLSLATTVIALWLYITEIRRAPEVMLAAHSPTPTIGKTIFTFPAGSSVSNPLKLDIALFNGGTAKSEFAQLVMTFSPRVQVSIASPQHWWSQSVGSISMFGFEDRGLTIPPSIRKTIGVFDIRIPKQDDEVLIAFFMLEGDFDRLAGLLYYRQTEQQYRLIQSSDLKEAADTWNLHLRSLPSQ